MIVNPIVDNHYYKKKTQYDRKNPRDYVSPVMNRGAFAFMYMDFEGISFNANRPSSYFEP